MWDLIELITDPGTFTSWDVEPVDVAPNDAYAADLARARERSGVDEAVITGEALVRGRRVAIIASEFQFLAGSIGIATAERLVLAIERATAEGLPLLAGPASGGTRMQEGTVAFVSMISITAAIANHKRARLPYLVYLRHPTTGGVMASWASLGHLTIAEPGALLGFLGPRVYEALLGESFPSGVQTSENLYLCGLIDGVVEAKHLPDVVHRALGHLVDGVAERGTARIVPTPERWSGIAGDPWASIERSRREDRPGIHALLRYGASDVLMLSGTGQGERDRGLVLALARFGGSSCIVIGHDSTAQRWHAPLGPAALREAQRGMRVADELGLPLVTVIDTPGAALSKEAEEGGLAGEIARCLEELVMLRVPTVSVILGEGTGGGALALLPADRIVAAEHGWLSPLPPEGASAIIHRDTRHAAEMASKQGVTAPKLLENGILDGIVPEHPDAADEPISFSRRVSATVDYLLTSLRAESDEVRLTSRLEKFRRIGQRG